MPGPIVGGIIFAGKTAWRLYKLWKQIHPDDDTPKEGDRVLHPWGWFIFQGGQWTKDPNQNN